MSDFQLPPVKHLSLLISLIDDDCLVLSSELVLALMVYRDPVEIKQLTIAAAL